jgi:hypothetical protein
MWVVFFNLLSELSELGMGFAYALMVFYFKCVRLVLLFL